MSEASDPVSACFAECQRSVPNGDQPRYLLASNASPPTTQPPPLIPAGHLDLMLTFVHETPRTPTNRENRLTTAIRNAREIFTFYNAFL